MISSKKDLNRDNQQGRFRDIGWIVGFVDGEGCFSISIFKNKTTKNGLQIFPEFVVTQGEKSLDSLKFIEEFFGCGKIFINHRKDNHNENLYRFCVRNIKDLSQKIIPFFETNQLKTAKIKDFEAFKKVVLLMLNKEHLTQNGFNKIIDIKQNLKTLRD